MSKAQFGIGPVLLCAVVLIVGSWGGAQVAAQGAATPTSPAALPTVTGQVPAAQMSEPAIPDPVAVELDPATTAYLVLDFSSVICTPRPSCVAVLPAARALLEKARQANVLVVYSDIPVSTSTILSEVAPSGTDPKVAGPADKFFGTNLDEVLKQKGIKTVVIAGYAANGAVLYTAFGATVRGYTAVVVEDAIGSEDPYAVQLTRYQVLNQPGLSNPQNKPLELGRVTLSRTDLLNFGAPPAAGTQPTAAAGSATSATGQVTIRWFGQAMFTLDVENGPTIMMDPVNPSVGYQVSPMADIDLVTVSHEHADHNHVSLASGNPTILRGLANNDWAKVDEIIEGVRVRGVHVYHDDAEGTARGKNAIFVVEAANLRIVHLGDLGHLLTPEQITAIGTVDVLMIPVGGTFTIDAARATQVVEALKPRVVIPMHYKTPVIKFNLAPVDAFLDGKRIQKVTGNEVILNAQTLPQETTVLVLGYEPG